MTFTLRIDSFGKLELTDAQGLVYRNIRPVRAFPITNPNQGISLMDEDGVELAWINDPKDLPQAHHDLIVQSLAETEFMPIIERITEVSTFATPSIWDIKTNRGQTRLKLKGEEDIRRVNKDSLLISDANGIQFLIKSVSELDKTSRKILDRFL
jgi:hypothetical protein